MHNEKIALFDLDGTLADYDMKLLENLNSIRFDGEPLITLSNLHAQPPYIEKRRQIITRQVGWWVNLPRYAPGWRVLRIAHEIGFSCMILTKGPSTKSNAWSEKIEWCNKHLPPWIAGVTICHDKSLVYGRVLVDDYVPYIESWLNNRPRGLVIMPAHSHNENFKHKNVVRYDDNIEEVEERLQQAFNR
jgi:5'(3')-deoxyribonucleotidase